MNEKLFKVLEFKKILTEIEKYAKADISKKRVLSIMPFTDYNTVQYELEKTDQAVAVLTSIGNIPTAPFESIDKSVLKAQKGGILSIAEFYCLKQFLKICINLQKCFSESALQKLNIDKIISIVSYINIDTSLARELDRIFLDKESIADNATAELVKIRRDIKSAEADITAAVNSVLNNPSNRKYLSDTVPAMKNQRLTVPVRAEFKEAIKGVIHDISATGATVFIEPEKAFSLNNKLNELHLKESIEVEKILSSLSESVSFVADDLLSSFDAVISLDVVFSKAQYALSIKAVKPEITRDGNTCIYSARHPLLDKVKAVPSDIIFKDIYRVIVITGPNTGGKTVALKTLALACVMTQSGILIPAKEYSKVRVFKKIFADIGDEQSIEQSLSTFSSHMMNIIDILNQADSDTLIIIDEIGAGTDPQEGAALGMAIIDTILEKGSKAFVSTHYSELKKYALIKDGTINASVEFDATTLMPTYKLTIGLPGESNAIKIASRLGLSEEVLKKARSYISREDESFEQILNTIKEKQAKTEEYTQIAEQKLKSAEQYYNEAKEEKQQISDRKTSLINDAKAEAQRIISKANKESNALISQLIDMKLGAETNIKDAEEIRGSLRRLSDELKPDKEQKEINIEGKVDGKFAPGDEVYIKSINSYGTITRNISKKEYEVTIGSMRLKFLSDNLSKVKKDSKKSYTSVKRQKKQVGTSIDVRGQDSIDAIKEIDKYLDDASIAGYKSVMIIHGKGEGVLKKETEQFLKSNSLVRSFRQGVYTEGGSGVTVVELV